MDAGLIDHQHHEHGRDHQGRHALVVESATIVLDPQAKPRHADQRVGYFHVGHSDLGKYHREDVDQYYIARWPLQKRDSKLKKSPPKEPIVYYIENTVPVRYRRYVKQGIEYWNRAYENIGILDAIEVRYQDKETGAHMDKDPEDVRYNFIRWLNNNIGVAIGPSRAHPETGEIFDADVVLTDGWIRAFWYQYDDLLPETAMEGMSRGRISWLDTHPMWDPRIRLAPTEQRAQLLAERARRLASGQTLETDTALLGNPEAQRLAEEAPAAILLDRMMPEMDGFEFLACLRNNKAWRSIPVIVVTAKTLTAADHKRLKGSVEMLVAKGGDEIGTILASLKKMLPAPARAGK